MVWGKPCSCLMSVMLTVVHFGVVRFSVVCVRFDWICCSFVTRYMKLFQSHDKCRARICHEHVITIHLTHGMFSDMQYNYVYCF